MVGVVTEIGSAVTSVKPEDYVIAAQPGLGMQCDNICYVMMTYTGTWRETLVCHHDKLLVVPATLPINLAATLMVNPPTAYRMMSDFVDLKEGNMVYVVSQLVFVTS